MALSNERIAKVIARAGIASRREAERMIEAGRVSVNGKPLGTPAFLVGPKDIILVDGQPIGAKEPARLWRYHKPSGLLTTHNDPGGRPTVFDNLPEDLPRVISVGRLDMTSEGLLLLTNDGEIARTLELPATAWARRYRARAYGRASQEKLDQLQEGIVVDGVRTGPIEAVLDKQKGDNAWISIMIREGKNREVRRALETLDLKVNRLIRLSYGPFQLGDLAKGKVEEVKTRILRDQVGHLVPIAPPKPRPTRFGQKKVLTSRGSNRVRSKKPNFKTAGASPSSSRPSSAKTKSHKPGAKSINVKPSKGKPHARRRR